MAVCFLLTARWKKPASLSWQRGGEKASKSAIFRGEKIGGCCGLRVFERFQGVVLVKQPLLFCVNFFWIFCPEKWL